MRKIKKELKIKLITLAVLLGLILIFQFFLSNTFLFNYKEKQNNVLLAAKSADLVVEYGSGKSRRFSGEVVDGMTVLSAILATDAGAALKFKYKTDNRSVIINSLDGYPGAKHKGSWSVSINRQPIDLSKINQTEVKSGDLIEFKFNESK